MASKTLTIEIGSHLTKVCQSAPKGKTWQIRSSFFFQTPDGAVSDGEIQNMDALAERLHKELVTHGVTDAKNVVFTITSGRIASREVMLPPVKDNRIKAIVDANAADYFPVDMSGYHVTYSLLERIDKGENPGCRILVLAAPLNLLEGYFKLADQLKLNIRAIDYAGNSQYQALKNLPQKGAVMYVNVDCTSSMVSFVNDGTLLLQRSMTFGGDELVSGYMTAAGMGSDQYAEALDLCSQDGKEFLAKGVLTSEDVNEGLSRLVSNIVRSSDYFSSGYPEIFLERVVLMGACSRLVGLKEAVSSATGLDTMRLDELDGASAFTNSNQTAAFYISCIGSPVAPVDFMPPQFIVDKKKARAASNSDPLIAGVVVCGLGVIAAVALSCVALFNYTAARNQVADLEAEIAQLQYAQDVYDTYLSYQAGSGALLSLDASIDSPNDELEAFIGELERKMPREITVLSAVCTRTNVSMNVNVPSYDEAAVVIAQLRTFESLDDVQVSAITEVEDETGGVYATFSLSCTYAVITADETVPAETGTAAE